MYSRLQLNYFVSKAATPPRNNRITANQASQSTKNGNSAKRIPSIIASPIIPPALSCLVSGIISPPVEYV
jgi:hypothetical protein